MIDLHVSWGDGVPLDGILDALRRSAVDRAILGPTGSWAAVDNTAGNDQVAAAVRAHPELLAGWAVANPWYGERAAVELNRALDAGLVGLELVPHLQGLTLLSPVLGVVLAVAAERGVPVYVVTGVPVASEPLQLTELARRWPSVRFVMGRSGRTDFSLDLIAALEGAPNIYAETAYNGPRDLRRIIDAVGAERVAFASDHPENDLELELDRLHRSGLSDAELAQVLDATARRLLSGARDGGGE